MKSYLTHKDKASWKDYSLARMNLIAGNVAGCKTSLPKPSDQAIKEFRDHLERRMDLDNLRFFDLRERVIANEFPPGSLGDAMRVHYEKNGIGRNDGTDVFPLRYIFLHDAHHALLGLPTTNQGELNVIAFECAAIDQGRSVASLMPVVAQVLAFSDWIKESCLTLEKEGNQDPAFHPLRVMAEYWQIGATIEADLLETWDVEKDLPIQVTDLLKKYNIKLPFNV